MMLTVVFMIPTALSVATCIYVVFWSDLNPAIKGGALAATCAALAIQFVPYLQLRLPFVLPVGVHIGMTLWGMVLYGNHGGGYDAPAKGIDAFADQLHEPPR